MVSRSARLLAGLALVLVAALGGSACAVVGGPRVEPVAPEASAAFAEALDWLRDDGDEALRRARQAAERAAALDPGWVAPQRLLDDLLRDDLLGLEALRERRRALEREPESGAALYLVGRLEGSRGRDRFLRAAAADPDLAWGHHGLAWSHAASGRWRRAAALERRALERARDSFERSYFTQVLARYLQASGRTAQAIDALRARLDDPDVHPADRIALGVQTALGELGALFDAELRERGFVRGLELLRGEDLTEDELRTLVTRMTLHGGRRSREELLLELELALAARPGPERRLLRAELLLAEGPSPLSIGLLMEGGPERGGEDDAAHLRVSHFVAGAFRSAVERWLSGLPGVVLDDHGLPRDPRLARVVRAALAAGDQPESRLRAAELDELAEALIEAGWFLEARAVAARLADDDLERALALETRAAAGRALVRGITRLIDEASSASARLPARKVGDLDDLLAELDPLWLRWRALLVGEGAAGEPPDADAPEGCLADSPRLTYGPFGAVVHPGPFFSRVDERAERGKAGEPVPGLAAVMDRVGRFALLGERMGMSGPDGTVLRRLWVERRSGSHLGVPWEGTVAWCEGAELESRVGRLGARIAGAALHEGYWVDVSGPRRDLEVWRALERRFFGPDAPRERSLRPLEAEAIEIASDKPGTRRAERVRLLSPLGEDDRLRLAVMRDRLASGAESGIDLDDLIEVTATHEEGHLCDRTRFLPLSLHWGRALALLARSGFSPSGVEKRLEYRAQLTSLCVVPDPRMALAEILGAAETVEAGPTVHADAYTELAEDFLAALDRRLLVEPERWPRIEGDRYLVHQLHRLGPEEVRTLALDVARREGLLENGFGDAE